MALNIRVSETIGVAPEPVFAALTDLGRMVQWLPNAVSIEVLTEGPLAVGTRFRETRRMFGRNASEVFRVTGLEKGRTLTTFCDGRDGTLGRGVFVFQHEVRKVPGGTEIVLSGTMDKMGGPIRTLLARFLRFMFVSAMKKDLAALKKYLEGRAA